MRRWIIQVALFLVSWSALAQPQQYVVLDSVRTGSSRFAAGAVLQGGEQIDLTIGARLVVLSATGDVLRLEGPVTYQLPTNNVAHPHLLDRLRQLVVLLKSDRSNQSTVSGVRSAVRQRGRPRWAIDPRSGGVKCVARTEAPILWLPQTSGERSIAVMQQPNGLTSWVRFAEGATTAPWPGSIPLVDGGEYRLTVGPSMVTSITVAIIDEAGSLGETALRAGAKNCDEAVRIVQDILLSRS